MSGDFFEFQTLSVGLTTRCNLHCAMCPVVRSEPASLTRDQALHIVDFALRRKFRRIIIGGGEPTLMPYFWEMFDTLAASDIAIDLLTNATLLREEHIQKLAACPRLIVNISVDGLAETHDAIRGAGMFAKTDAAIRALLDAGARVAVNTVVQKSNYKEMFELHRYFCELPLEWHGFQFAEEYYGDLELVPPEVFDEALEILERVRRDKESRGGSYSLTRGLLYSFKLFYKYPRLKVHPGLGCTIPRRLVTVNHNAEVMPCWHYGRWSPGENRSLASRTLDEIVDDPAYREEIARVIGPNGCEGCSTTCYLWDETFYAKMMHPSAQLWLRREGLHLKEYLRKRHPAIFGMLKRLRGQR